MNKEPKRMTFSEFQKSFTSMDEAVATSQPLPNDGEEVRRIAQKRVSTQHEAQDNVAPVKRRTEVFKDGQLYSSQG